MWPHQLHDMQHMFYDGIKPLLTYVLHAAAPSSLCRPSTSAHAKLRYVRSLPVWGTSGAI
jgi:hypothetical protein